MAVLAEASDGLAPAYGADPWTGRAIDMLRRWFERDVMVFFVGTGSAANGLALASVGKPGGVVFSHVDAHIVRDEPGGIPFFLPGTMIDQVDGPGGRIDPHALAARLADYPAGDVHHGRPAAVSIANVNEIGQTYAVSEVAEIAAVAKSRGAAVHMDGARFANALAHTGASPADLTWRAGVDVLSLGFTKTGGWCAEALVYFDAGMREDVAYRHKQAGQLLSKNRFAAAQFVALLHEDLARTLAHKANGRADEIHQVLTSSNRAAPLFPPQSNEVFAYIEPQSIEALDRAKLITAPWSSRSSQLPPPPDPTWRMRRFVASYRSSEADIARLSRTLGVSN